MNTSKAKRRIYDLSAVMLAIISLGWPILVATFSNIIVGIVDVAVVGHLGNDHLAGAGVAIAVFAIATETLSGLVLGFQIILARLMGARETHEAASLIRRFSTVSTIAAFAAILLLVMSHPVLLLIADNERVAKLAMIYLLWRSPSLLIMTASWTLRTALDVSGFTKPGMWAALTANIVNGISAPLFVFGFGPFVELGMAGAGLAGTLGSLAGVLVIVGFWIHYQPFPIFNTSFSPSSRSTSVREVLSLSGYEITNAFLDYAGNLLFVAIVAAMGTVALASSRIAFSILLVCFAICGSFATASQILMGREFGADRSDQVTIIFRGALAVIFAIGLSLGSVLTFAPSTILWVYTGSSELSTTVTPLLTVVAVTILPLAINSALVAKLRAAKASRHVMLINIIAIWAVQLPAAWLLGDYFGLGVAGAYWGVCTYFIARALTAGLILHSATKKIVKDKATPENLTADRQTAPSVASEST